MDVAGVAVDLRDLLAQPAGGRAGVELGLHDDPAGHQVQAAGEAQQRRHLRLAAAGPGHREPGQLVLDRRGHRHAAPEKIDAYVAPSRAGSCRAVPSSERHRGQHQTATRGRDRGVEPVRVGDGRPVGEHDVERQSGGVRQQDVEVGLRGEPGGLPRLRREVERHQPTCRRLLQGLPQLAHEQVRQHAGEPRARPEHDPLGVEHGLDRLLAGRRVGRAEPDVGDDARRSRRPRPARAPRWRRRGRPPARRRARRSPAGCSWPAAPGPAAPSSRPTTSSASTTPPSVSVSAASSRLPTACPRERPVATEPVLQQPLPAGPPGVLRRPGRRAPSAGHRAAARPARPAAGRWSRRRRRR